MSDGVAQAKAISGSSQLLVDTTATGVTGHCTLNGWSLRETAGAVGIVRIRAGSVTGVILATLGFVALESKNLSLETGLLAAGGLYVQIVSGTIEGSVWYS